MDYASISLGLSDVAQYAGTADQRRQEAAMRQQQSQAQLQLAQTQQTGAELANQQLQLELRQAQASAFRSDSFNAFGAYEVDGDARHLNTLLQDAKTSPVGTMWKKWARFDTLTASPEVERQLKLGGYSDPSEIISSPELSRKFILGTDVEGNQQVLDMDELYKRTGYHKYMTTQQLEMAKLRADTTKALRGPQSAELTSIRTIQQENGIPFTEAAKQYYGMKRGGFGGSSVERVAQQLREQDPSLSYEDSLSKAAATTAPPTSAERGIDLTREIRTQLHGLSETGSFYDLDLEDPTTRARAGELIVDLEKASGKKVTGATKVTVRNLRSLAALGANVADDLSAEETGYVDSMLHNFSKYVSNSTEGFYGSASYETFRNVFRNSLYGASLTNSEIEAFEAAAGNLKQELGPVLQQFKVQLEDVRNQISSVMDMEDPMVARYYLGMQEEEVHQVLRALNERIDFVSGKAVQRNTSRLSIPQTGTRPQGVSAEERFKQLTGQGN